METDAFTAHVRRWTFLTEEMRNRLISIAGTLTADERGKVVARGNALGADFLISLEEIIPSLTHALQGAKRDIRTADESRSRAEDQASLPDFSNA